MSKEYGLIIPNKNKTLGAKKPTVASVFNQDSDSDESAKPTGFTGKIKRQDCIVQQRAVEEDPTVFQYDEIYDDMAQKRIESKLANKDVEKKPKYINRLLVAAERRKRENERRIEREVQREREAEGAEFKDKEAFVTAAYKKKLEEFKEMEEQERREEYLEAIGDVTKQGNLDGFYRHLYEQKVNTDKVTIKKEDVEENKIDEEKNEIKDESGSDKEKSKKKQPHKKSHTGDESESDIKETTKKKRVYRKHNDSAASDSDEEKTTLTHLPSNIDADSDFSIDSDSDEEPKEKKIKEEPKEETTVPESNKNETEDVKKEEEKVEVQKPEEKKVKIDIWKKRTVGVVFDEALQRYYERKALRNG